MDCGISVRNLQCNLERLGLGIDDITCVFITHLHTDHISGLKALLSKASPIVIGPQRLKREVEEAGCDFMAACEGTNRLNGIGFKCLRLPHDANPTYGYRIEIDGRKVAIATDLGMWDAKALELIDGCDLVLWEANHDELLLEHGSYPWFQKQRIRGPLGHLSNRKSVEAVLNLDKPPSTLVLGHLSRVNNRVELVRDTYEASHIDKFMKMEIIDPFGQGVEHIL